MEAGDELNKESCHIAVCSLCCPGAQLYNMLLYAVVSCIAKLNTGSA